MGKVGKNIIKNHRALKTVFARLLVLKSEKQSKTV